MDGSTLSVTAYTVNDGNSGDDYAVIAAHRVGDDHARGLDITRTSDSKTYDGTTSSSAVPTHSGMPVGRHGDAACRRRSLAERARRRNSTLQVTGYTVNDGNSGNDYTVATHTASGTITTAALDIYAVADSKVYDGTTSSSARRRSGGSSSRATR